MRELMPFVKGKKLYEETGSDLTPKPGIKGTQVTGDLAYSMFEQSAGSKSENKIKRILDEVTEYTPKQFLKKYSQQDYNLMTSMLEDAGYGTATKNKAGNVTNFTLKSEFKGQGIGGSRLKTFDKFDLPPELQGIGGMSFGERLSEPTEKYIAGVTDKTTVIQPGGYDEIVRADTGIFDEGGQSRATAAIRDDIKVLEDVIESMSDEDFDRPINNKDMRVEESRRLARQNKARLRAGLEPKLEGTKLINPAMDEFAGMSVGEYYTNQLAAKRASLNELKRDLGVGSEQVELMNRIDTASPSMSVSDLEATTSRVETPSVTKANPITGVKDAQNINVNKIAGNTSGAAGYAAKSSGKNVFSIVGKMKDFKTLINKPNVTLKELDAFFEGRLAKGLAENEKDPTKGLKTIEEYKNYSSMKTNLQNINNRTKGGINVAGKLVEDIRANLEKADMMGTGLQPRNTTASPDINRLVEELESPGSYKSINTEITGGSVRPEIQGAVEIQSQIQKNTAALLGKDYEGKKIAGIDESGNAYVNKSKPSVNRVPGPPREYDYDTEDGDFSSSRTAELDTIGIEPEGYSKLNRTVTLPGENPKQAARRNAVLAKISGWDFESGAWKANSDINAYEGRQRTLRTLVDQGAINPNDIAWNAINADIDAGTFDSNNIKKYLKLSGASDTAASALKTSVNIKTSGRVKSPVTIGSSQVPAVKPATQVAPTKPDTSKKLNVKSITDAEIKTLPIYKMMRDEFSNTESLKALSSDALDNYTVKQARNQLNILSKQEGAAGRGFAKMIETIIKSR
jgi:hypothetical protein